MCYYEILYLSLKHADSQFINFFAARWNQVAADGVERLPILYSFLPKRVHVSSCIL